MKTIYNHRASLRAPAAEKAAGFSFIELIGVVAVLVILACLIIPRVINRQQKSPATVRRTVDEARIANAVLAMESLKSAAMARYSETGSLGPVTNSSYDSQLLTGGFLSKPFDPELGTRSVVRLVNASALSSESPIFNTPGAYDLNGDGRNDVMGSHYVLETVIDGVTELEARALNDRLDGAALGGNVDSVDLKGRVIWSPQSRQLRIYITQGN